MKIILLFNSKLWTLYTLFLAIVDVRSTLYHSIFFLYIFMQRLPPLSCIWILDVERHLHSPFKETFSFFRNYAKHDFVFLHAHKPQNTFFRAALQRDCEGFLRIVQNGNFALMYLNNGGDKNSLLLRKFTRTRTCRRTTSKIHRALALALALLRSAPTPLSRPTRHFDKARR